MTTINAATQATHTKFVSPQSTPKGRREKKNDDDETPEPPGGDSVVVDDDDDDDMNDDVEMMTMKATEET